MDTTPIMPGPDSAALRVSVPPAGEGATGGELDEALFEEVIALFQQGDASIDQEAPLAAARSYVRAIELLPEPRTQWEAALHVYTALGDALLELSQPQGARESLELARLSPGGTENPYVWLRLGDAERLLGSEEAAVGAYTRAYEIAGPAIFEDEAEALALLERSTD